MTMKGLQVATITTKTILLINSESNVREVVEACLTHLGGWQILSTGSPSEGLRLAIQDQPDAIVFDLSTFGLDFYTFLKRLQAQPATQAIPVVLIATGTKWLNIKPLQRFQLAGVIDYSVDPTTLPQQIATLLNWDAEQLISEAEGYSS